MKQWEPEIEKKYKVDNIQAFEETRRKAEENGLVSISKVLQRDWAPDFADSIIKEQGMLLRIRHMEYIKGSGPEWLVTIKEGSVIDGVHVNKELEATSINQLVFLQEELSKRCGVEIDLKLVVEGNQDYIARIGLTKNRMMLEKIREEWIDHAEKIKLALDKLPEPLGCFIEIEGETAEVVRLWEEKLGLDKNKVVEEDYGKLVKSVNSQRILVFPKVDLTNPEMRI